MNTVLLLGRLTKDPVVSMSQGGTKIARYTLAVNRMKKQDGTQDADFINCICFNKSADFVERYLGKGMKIAIRGRIQTGSYQDKNGQKVYTTDIVVDEHEFCDSKSSGVNEQPAPAPVQAQAPTQTYNQPQQGWQQQAQQMGFMPQHSRFSTADLDGFQPVATDDGDLPF